MASCSPRGRGHRGGASGALPGFDLVDDEIREEDLNAVAYSEPGSSTYAEEDAERYEVGLGMHHNNARLQEMLNLARACLRSGRLPGETKPEDLYARWDREAAEEDQRKAEHFEELAKRADELIGIEMMCEPAATEKKVAPLRLATTPDSLPVREHIAKLKRDIQRIERSAHERRQELDAATADASREVLERCKAEEDMERLKEEVAKVRKNVHGTKDLFKRQLREIKEMDELIELTKQQGRALNPKAGRRGASKALAEKTLQPGSPAAPSQKPRKTPRQPRGAATATALTPSDFPSLDAVETEIPGIPKEWLPKPQPPPPVAGGLLQHLKAPEKAIPSVLSSRPKQYKVYI